MADGIQATVEGRVERVFKRGVRVKIRRESRDGDRRWVDFLTVWDLPGVSQGDLIRVQGDLSWRPSSFRGRARCDVSLNDPSGLEILEHAATPPADGEPVGAGWGA